MMYRLDLIFAIILINVFIPGNNSNCVAKGCFEATELIMNHTNRTVDPCDNFYKFACGGFFRTALLETKDMTPFHTLQKITRQKIEALISDPNTDDGVERPLRLLRQFYQSCLKIKPVDKKRRSILDEVIEKLGDWPVIKQTSWKGDDFNWIDFTIKSWQLGLDNDPFIRFGAETDLETTGLILLSIHPPSIDIIDGRFDNSYINLMTDIAVSMGAEANAARLQLPEILNLKKRLKSLVDDVNATKTEQKAILKISELQQRIPWINWLDFLRKMISNAVKIDENTHVILYEEEFYMKLQNLIAQTPKNIQANYAIWTIIEGSQMYLNKEIREKFTEFLNNTGKVVQTRESFCLSEAKSIFFPVADIAYVKKYTTPEILKDVNEMIANIKKQMIKKMKNSKWIDEESKIEAELCLNRIVMFVGWSKNVFEENFENMTSFSVTKFNWRSDDILDMVMMLRVHKFDRDIILVLNQNYSKLEDINMIYQPFIEYVNAYYMQKYERLVLPSSILQGVFYDINRPHYMNYGAIGVVIAHELTHGLSNTPRVNNKDTSSKNWWTNTTLHNYNNITKCLIEEYNNYPYHLSAHTKNGSAALEENFADFIGINLAYEAYQEWVAEHGAEESLPGINYTPNQMFWIMCSAFKCYQPINETDKIEKVDPHGVPSFGVLAGFQNSPHFAKDYGCALGSYMNPPTKCTILL